MILSFDTIKYIDFYMILQFVQVVFTIGPNGPAIKGGCVTRRSIRAGSWYFRQKYVPVQGGYGVLFAIPVQILESAGVIAVQVL